MINFARINLSSNSDNDKVKKENDYFSFMRLLFLKKHLGSLEYNL